MPVFKSENDLIRKWVTPNLKKKEYLVKKWIKLNNILQKLASEEVLTEDERNIKHPGQPDMDVVFWKTKTPKEAEPTIFAAEVKYFRPTKQDIYPKVFYAGLDESEILLTYGFDYVFLWHFFDPEVKEEKITQYRELMQNLITDAKIPIGYGTWTVSEEKEVPKNAKVLDMAMTAIDKTLNLLTFPYSSLSPPARNPLLSRWDVQKRRTVIRKALRIL